jgi:hypothetical protein
VETGWGARRNGLVGPTTNLATGGETRVEEVTERNAISRFAAMMNGFIASPPAIARTIVEAVVEHFRAVWVKGPHYKF